MSGCRFSHRTRALNNCTQLPLSWIYAATQQLSGRLSDLRMEISKPILSLLFHVCLVAHGDRIAEFWEVSYQE